METRRTTTVDWTSELVEQLDLHWRTQLRPRLEGLTDEEYRWEPVPGSWNISRRDDGERAIHFAYPEPVPAPVTTIAWRLAHINVGIFGMRNAARFGGPPIDYESA